jgi:hypothetical protein
MCDYPEYAEFLIESAEERLDKTFVETYKHFETLCKEHKADICMDEVVHDHMMEWHHAMKMKAESLEEKKKNWEEESHEKHPTKK